MEVMNGLFGALTNVSRHLFPCPKVFRNHFGTTRLETKKLPALINSTGGIYFKFLVKKDMKEVKDYAKLKALIYFYEQKYSLQYRWSAAKYL